MQADVEGLKGLVTDDLMAIRGPLCTIPDLIGPIGELGQIVLIIMAPILHTKTSGELLHDGHVLEHAWRGCRILIRNNRRERLECEGPVSDM